ncbi:MAG: hypothetical protein RLZ33_961 [Bacteroidota bacterium]
MNCLCNCTFVKIEKNFSGLKKGSVAQLSRKELVAPQSQKHGSVAQLNSALDFGSSGYRFESCRGHNLKTSFTELVFFTQVFLVQSAVADPLDFGSSGCGLESLRGHYLKTSFSKLVFFHSSFCGAICRGRRTGFRLQRLQV